MQNLLSSSKISEYFTAPKTKITNLARASLKKLNHRIKNGRLK